MIIPARLSDASLMELCSFTLDIMTKMPFSIKVCGMTQMDNIRALAALAPDWVGLIFHPSSPRNALALLPEELVRAREATDVRPLKFVGVFVDRPANEVATRAEEFMLSAVQLHGNESPEYCSSLRGHGFEVWKAVGIETADDFQRLQPYIGKVDRFVFDRKSPRHGGTGKKFDWNLLDGYNLPAGFMLGGGIGPGDAGKIAAIDHPQFLGVDLNSCFEISPGIKNIELLNEFITLLRQIAKVS